MSNNFFATAPTITIQRSKNKQKFKHDTSFQFGKLIPIDCFECVTGSTFKLDFAGVIRMAAPIAPILTDMKAKVHAFFVPERLLYTHAEEFWGANKTSAGPQPTAYKRPTRDIFSVGVPVHSVSDYLGKPVLTADLSKHLEVSVLKERGYWLIWSEWYRAGQIQDPFILDMGDGSNAGVGHIGATYYHFNSMPANVCKDFDYFTAATISPQYGQAVLLPLGNYAPVVTRSEEISGDPLTSTMHMKTIVTGTDATTGTFLTTTLSGGHTGVGQTGAASGAVTTNGLYPSNLWADLSNATAAKVNDIRYAFQVQKYLERSNFTGGRFFEILAAHYGVHNPDARLQRPEYLGGKEFYINIDQVFNTNDYANTTSSKLGQVGGVSITNVVGRNLFTYSVTEPGFIYVLISTTQQHIYGQGVLREDLKTDRFELYSPEFANLGDQEILKAELKATGTSIDKDVFGYQEHWAEYKVRKDRVSGYLNPNVSGSLDYWTLADKFATVPSLNEAFITENRNNITRALTTGDLSSGIDFIADFEFHYTCVLPMPVHTVPGLIDHFGGR